LIFEHSSDPTVIIDDDGRLLAANRAAHSLRGVDLERFFLWTQERDPELASLRAQLRVGGRGAVELRLPDGDEGARIVAVEGRAHGASYVLVMRDITDRRHLEGELRHLRQLEDVGYLAASAVHDFNNILTAIACSTSVLAGDVTGQERPSALARDILGSTERAAGLVRQVLSLLRRQPAKPERVSLNDAVEEARALVERILGPAVELSVRLDADLGDTLVEREQLDHVILNLAANARDAMPDGGGKVTLTTANVPFDDEAVAAAHCTRGLSYVSLTLTDSGQGMAPEVRERVFERFYSTKPTGKGTGLGLATAYRFVKRNGGCIAVRSTPGTGTSVAIYLPSMPSPAQTIVPPREEGETPSGTETLLLIDPDDPVRGAIRAVLGELGYRVVHAPTGERALEEASAAELRIDLVLAELRSSGMAATEVVARLRALGQSPALLWMSGDTERAIAERGLDGAPLLRKAFTPGQLARRVRAALDSSVAGEASAASRAPRAG
jgi:signal transduction histidine kinase